MLKIHLERDQLTWQIIHNRLQSSVYQSDGSVILPKWAALWLESLRPCCSTCLRNPEVILIFILNCKSKWSSFIDISAVCTFSLSQRRIQHLKIQILFTPDSFVKMKRRSSIEAAPALKLKKHGLRGIMFWPVKSRFPNSHA